MSGIKEVIKDYRGNIVLNLRDGSSVVLPRKEEGLWTPAGVLTTPGDSSTGANATGSYTRIDSLVNVSCYLEFSKGTTGAGSFSISGLPFTSENKALGFAGALAYVDGLATANSIIYMYAGVNTTNITVTRLTNGNAGAFSPSDMGTTLTIIVSFSYRV